jgi:hypothetical protein
MQNFVMRLDKNAELENTLALEEAVSSEPVPPADIVSFNELRSCADLYRLFSTGKLEIQPDFQREVVWKPNEQARFIDSLVKQLPIPSMCFGLDYKTQRWKVIDGLQRMSAIISFLGDAPWRLKALDDIHPLLRGSRNIDLKNGNDESQLLYSTVLDVSIPITVLRCDYAKSSHMEYLFTIFHRLNSGGVRLNNQEIRNCIYNGKFNTALKDFDRKDSSWSKIKKRVWGSSDRFRSVELLLRVLAFSEGLDAYSGNLAKFLNDYMYSRIDSTDLQMEQLKRQLEATSEAALHALSGAPSGKISMTFIEATLVGIFCNLDASLRKDRDALSASFGQMMSDPAFFESAKYAIASEKNVKSRLGVAIKVFSGS